MEPNLAGMKILVVDDDADALELLVFVLSTYDIHVIPASSAAEALALMPSSFPDLIVCDIGMPEVDGYTLMRRIRAMSTEQGGDIPAIAITAYGDQEVREISKNADFQDYLIKPFEPQQLLFKIAALSKSTRSTQCQCEQKK